MTRIRSFENDDIGAITNMVSLGYPFEPGQTPEQTVKEEITNCDVWVYDDGSLKGISSVRGSYGGNDSVLIKLYTHPNERGNGIGSCLWNRTRDEIEKRHVRKVVSFYVQNLINRAFYEHRGFQRWYGWTDMQYRGTVQMVDDLNLVVRPYEDSIFEQWIKGFGDAYRQLFMEADMEPEDEDKEGNRRWANENRGNLFAFFDGSEFIGSCHLRDGYIRSMFVCPQHQGRGYGKRILQYIIAQAQMQCSDLIRLAVLDINERANNLYRTMGFEVERSFELSRLNIY